MRPDRTNYEIWLIDYLDGNLDSESAELLLAFLEENPDIREELNHLISYKINPGSGSYRNKALLKRSADDLSESQFNLLCVASAENDLSGEEAAELNELVSHSPEKRKTFDTIKSLRLNPPQIEFRYKYKLRKLTLTQKVIRFSVIGLSAAASLFIAVSVFNRQVLDTRIKTSIAAADSVIPGKITVPEKTPEKNQVAENRKIEIQGNVTRNTGLAFIAAAENKPASSENPGSDTSKMMMPERISISMIDFKKEVTLDNAGFEASLIAFNMAEIKVNEEISNGLNGFIARLFREKIMKSESPGQGNLKAYEIADAGISGLNRLLGWEMSLQKNKDEKGVVKSVNFNSKLLKFNAPVKKVQLLP